MTELGIKLNLKKHLVGDKEMALSADIEGHCGTVGLLPSGYDCAHLSALHDTGWSLLCDRLWLIEDYATGNTRKRVRKYPLFMSHLYSHGILLKDSTHWSLSPFASGVRR